MLQTIGQRLKDTGKHLEKLQGLTRYRDLEHITIYFVIYDHPGFWPIFIVAFIVHVTLGVKRRVSALDPANSDVPIEPVKS